jgi:hypothetical protein
MPPRLKEPDRSRTRSDENTPLLADVEPIPITDSESVSPQLSDGDGSRNQEEQED